MTASEVTRKHFHVALWKCLAFASVMLIAGVGYAAMLGTNLSDLVNISDILSTHVFHHLTLSLDDSVAISDSESLSVARYDVAVTGFSVSRDFTYDLSTAFPIKVNVTLANHGTTGETFTVTVRANTAIIETQTVTLASGAGMILSFDWNAQLMARGTYTLSAEASMVPGESYVTDNNLTFGTFQVRKAGDVDGDGDVDIDDLIAVWQNQFTSTIPSYYDIDNDGDVDVDDLILTWSHQFT